MHSRARVIESRTTRTEIFGLAHPAAFSATMADAPEETIPSHFKSHQDEELIRLALHNSPFFSCLDEEQLDRFVAAAELKSFANPGHVVIAEGRIDEETTLGNANNVVDEESLRQDIPSINEVFAPQEETEHSDPKSSEVDKDTDSKNDNEENPLDPLPDIVKVETPDVPSLIDETAPPDVDDHAPIKSGIPRLLYIVRSGKAKVWLCRPTSFEPFSPATLGEGSIFGEGGFLFGRQHSASVRVDSPPLECWVVDIATFRDSILLSGEPKRLFQEHATHQDEDGEWYMTVEDFVTAITNGDMGSIGLSLPQESSLLNLHIANTYNVLHAPHNASNPTSQRLYLKDFCFFHFIVARPDPEVDLAFLLMDDQQTGKISLDDLKRFLGPVFPGLDFNQAFFKRYFGEMNDKTIRQGHFSQFLVDLQREIGKQAFLQALAQRDSEYLDAVEFVRILKSSAWRIPAGVIARLETLYDASHNSRGTLFSYGDFLAFQEVLGNLPFICNMIDRVEDLKGTKDVSPDDFKIANQVLGLGDRFSRRQVDIVFQLFDVDKDGFVSHDDTVAVCGLDFARRLVYNEGKLAITPAIRAEITNTINIDDEVQQDRNRSSWGPRVASSIFDFSFAAVFGGFAVGILYPIDIVKTRIMNQRRGRKNALLYQGSLDCLRQIIRNEGIPGLYRGIIPNLLCVAPERAIKLQVHHLVKEAVCSVIDSDPSTPSLWLETFAGGCAGASQILVTNPMEIAKIRLQMQGETKRVLLAKGITPLSAPGFLGVMRGLGFPGVYRGASACLLRDIPFSAIYFTSYAALRRHLTPPDGAEKYGFETLVAGTAAAIPAALITNPADVVKTRLQTIARPGETSYHGIKDCFTKVLEEEGPMAFMRGSVARVLRIAPQFGISMLAFDTVLKLLQLSSYETARPPTDVPVESAKRSRPQENVA